MKAWGFARAPVRSRGNASVRDQGEGPGKSSVLLQKYGQWNEAFNIFVGQLKCTKRNHKSKFDLVWVALRKNAVIPTVLEWVHLGV